MAKDTTPAQTGGQPVEGLGANPGDLASDKGSGNAKSRDVAEPKAK